MINVVEPCERVQERRVFVFAMDCLSVTAVVAKAASAKICALNVFHALEAVIIHVPKLATAFYSVRPAE